MRRISLALCTALLLVSLGAAAASASPGSPRRSLHPLVHGTSGNWVGYASLGSFVGAHLAWTQPAVDCSQAPNGVMGFEVGLDGAQNAFAEQVGTTAICTDGTPAYYDWWLMYPATPDIVIVHSVSVGDAISASVTSSSGQFKLKVVDRTDPSASFTTVQECAECPGESVEWLGDRQFATNTMADFGTMKFTHASATDSTGHTGFIDDPAWDAGKIYMVNDNGDVIARASTLNRRGNGFSVAWRRPE